MRLSGFTPDELTRMRRDDLKSALIQSLTPPPLMGQGDSPEDRAEYLLRFLDAYFDARFLSEAHSHHLISVRLR